MKIFIYGVRDTEKPLFEKFNTYGFDLTFYPELLTHANADKVEGHDAVLLRANCVADRQNLALFKEKYGIKYVFTRTAGVNHIDLDAAEELGIFVARVPGYSPSAIAELSLITGLSLFRQLPYVTDRTSKGKLAVDSRMFSREIHNQTVGIIGMGRIGVVEAKLYRGLGAEVIGYDPYPSDAAKEVVTFVDQDELLERSSIVSLHVPYIKGENDRLIDAEFLSKMQDNSVLVNTSRGELQDNDAVADAIESGKLQGFAADVLPHESEIFYHDFDSLDEIPDKSAQRLLSLYPQVLITPHMGFNTDVAVSNIISTILETFHDVFETGESDNLVVPKH